MQDIGRQQTGIRTGEARGKLELLVKSLSPFLARSKFIDRQQPNPHLFTFMVKFHACDYRSWLI